MSWEIIDETQTDQVEEMDAFVASHPKGHFLQSPRWRLVKPHWQWRGILAQREGRLTGTLSILIRPFAPGFALLYAPRGPVCAPEDKETMAQLCAGAEALARCVGGFALILDPDIPEGNICFANDLEALGFCRKQTMDFSGIQPRFVFRLSLSGLTLEEVFQRFSSKTRYQIRLAMRKRVQVRFWPGDQPVPSHAIASFAALMETTGRRDHFLVRNRDYFACLLQALGSHSRLYLAFLDEEAIAGAIAVQFGDKTWYLYGASSNRHRNAMPNYLLQWEMIRWAVEQRCRVYDFRGVPGDLDPEHPLYGLYRFKKGFGGTYTAFCGEFIRVYHPLRYRFFQWIRWGNRKIRKLLRVLHSRQEGPA